MIQSGPDAAASPAPGQRVGRHPVASAHPGEPRSKVTLASESGALSATDGARGGSGPTTHAPTTTTAPVPTTVAAPVETTAPTQEVAARVVSVPTTRATTPPTSTTTTSTPPPVAAPAPGPMHEGQVTYYDHPAGTCASPWLPFGTVVRVTNQATGESVSCVVNDREVDRSRAIDLATATFAEIAPLSQGVIDAQLSW